MKKIIWKAERVIIDMLIKEKIFLLIKQIKNSQAEIKYTASVIP